MHWPGFGRASPAPPAYALGAEHGRADELQDRIEALQVQLADGNALTIETAELAVLLRHARAEAQEAAQAVAEGSPASGAWRDGPPQGRMARGTMIKVNFRPV